MKRVLAQCSKELAQFRRDKLTVALAYLLPCVAMMLYGFATRLEAKNIAVAVKNYDVGRFSREYVSTLFANGQLTPAHWKGRDVMTPLDLGIAKACIVIPPEFSRKLKQRTGAEVQVIVDATDVNNARVIKNSVLATTNYFLKKEKLSQTRPLVRPSIRLWFNPGRKESLYVAPGALGVFLWIFPCLLSTLAISREKEQGTILQVYASSLTAPEFMAGKLLAYFLIGLTQAVILIGFSTILFKLQFVGNLPMFLLALFAFLACSICFGLLAGSRTNSQSAAVQLVATTGFTTSLLLSGFLYPVRNIQVPLNYLSEIVPARYFVEASRNFFVRGSDFSSQLYILFALSLAFVVLFNGASRLMRRMQLKA